MDSIIRCALYESLTQHAHTCTAQLIKGMQPVPYAVAQLAAIRETSVCNYTLTVCTPLLCDATADPAAAAAAAAAGGVAPLTGAAGKSVAFVNPIQGQRASRSSHPYPLYTRTAKSPVLRLLEPLSQFCLTRHEGYWSYEFCYKRGVRQFHNVAVRDPKGACVPACLTTRPVPYVPSRFDSFHRSTALWNRGPDWLTDRLPQAASPPAWTASTSSGGSTRSTGRGSGRRTTSFRTR